MRDEPDIEQDQRSRALLRLIALTLGSLEIIAFTLAAHLHLLSGRELDEGYVLLHLIPLVSLTTLGLLLAWMDRAPSVALGLVVLALPIAGMLIARL